MNPWLVISASPRSGGNSDYASGLLATSLREGGALVEQIFLREHPVAPCVSCGLCASAPGSCSLDACFTGRPDDAAALFERMRGAAGLVFAIPVYFYGLPAHLKGLVDRSQRFWRATEDAPGPVKPAYGLHIAGRVQGERLFDAPVLVMRSFLRMIGYRLNGHLPLRGIDGPEDLAAKPDLCGQIKDWSAAFLQVSG